MRIDCVDCWGLDRAWKSHRQGGGNTWCVQNIMVYISVYSLLDLGAHVTLFSRRQPILQDARQELMEVRVTKDQVIHAVSVDLANAREVSFPTLFKIHDS